MKKLAYLIIVLLFTINLTSCGTVSVEKESNAKEINKKEENLTTFTLKDKEEVMQRAISHKKRSTIIAQP